MSQICTGPRAGNIWRDNIASAIQIFRRLIINGSPGRDENKSSQRLREVKLCDGRVRVSKMAEHSHCQIPASRVSSQYDMTRAPMGLCHNVPKCFNGLNDLCRVLRVRCKRVGQDENGKVLDMA